MHHDSDANTVRTPASFSVRILSAGGPHATAMAATAPVFIYLSDLRRYSQTRDVKLTIPYLGILIRFSSQHYNVTLLGSLKTTI
jgi:hypothetical protein